MRFLSLMAMLFAFGGVISDAQPKDVRVSVADILAERAKLNGAVVTLSGGLGLSAELSFFSDESHCRGFAAEPCKLDFVCDKCRISGSRYSALECGEAIRRLLGDAGFPLPLRRSVVVKGVVVSGKIATRPAAQSDAAGGKLPPRAGFGHLGTFPAQINATAMNLDRADVVAAKGLSGNY